MTPSVMSLIVEGMMTLFCNESRSRCAALGMIKYLIVIGDALIQTSTIK